MSLRTFIQKSSFKITSQSSNMRPEERTEIQVKYRITFMINVSYTNILYLPEVRPWLAEYEAVRRLCLPKIEHKF